MADNGPDALSAIETVRALAKAARSALHDNPSNNSTYNPAAGWAELASFLASQNDAMLVIIARAFNQFLNLANIAEQAHIARQNLKPLTLPAHLDLRGAIGEALLQPDSPPRQQGLKRLIVESWHSDEIRKTRPTPQNETKWGFAVIESSLWEAVPAALC